MYDSALVQPRKSSAPKTSWDSNRWYSNQVWSIPPISAEEERSVAKRIVEAEQAMLTLALQDRRNVKELVGMMRRFLDGKLRARELFETEKDRDRLKVVARKALSRLLRTYRKIKEVEEMEGNAELKQARLDTLRSRLSERIWEMPVNRRLVHRLGNVASTREIKRLGERIQRLKQKLVQPHLRLALSMARRYSGRGLSHMDLVQEGNTGLLLASDKFDYRHGFRFSTYAGWWIRQCIIRALAHQSRLIRVPVNLNTQIIRLERDRAALARELDRIPTVEELAKRVKITTDRVNDLLSYRKTVISLETPLDGEGKLKLGDVIEDPDIDVATDVISAADARRETKVALGSLAPREQEVMRRRFGLDGFEIETLAEIGRKLGISRERVRQIQERALERLRHPSRVRRLVALR